MSLSADEDDVCMALRTRRWGRRQGLLTFVCITSLLAGCVHVDYWVSAPDALPAGTPGRVLGSRIAELRLDQLKLKVSALDFTVVGGLEWPVIGFLVIPAPYKNHPTPVPPLMVLLDFDPAGLGFSFDPMKVTVRNAERAVLRPVAWVGPGRLGWRDDERKWECLGRRYAHLTRRTDDVYEPLSNGHSCFVVAFDVTVTPPSRVELVIDGITNGTQPVPIAGLTLSRRKLRSTDIEVAPNALR